MKTLLGALAMVLAVQAGALAQNMNAASPAPSGAPAGGAPAAGAPAGGGAVTLTPAGQKKPSGSAVFSQKGSSVTVTLTLPEGYQPGKAAIYSGTCSSTNASTAMNGSTPMSLNVNASGQPSTTTINATLDSLTSSPHVVVVMGKPALCGDISNMLPPQKP